MASTFHQTPLGAPSAAPQTLREMPFSHDAPPGSQCIDKNFLPVNGIRESSISRIPTVEMRKQLLLLNKFATCDFDCLHKIRKSY
jgi:hypothetical protein